MELLRNEDGLIEEIHKDAETKAESIRRKARKQADRMLQEAEETVSKMLNVLKKTSLAAIEIERKRIIATVDVEVKRKQLKKIGQMIDEVFEEAKKHLSQSQYMELIFFHLKEAVSCMNDKEFSVEIDKLLLEKIGEERFLHVGLEGEKKIVELKGRERYDGLMVYNSNRTLSAFFSLDHFFEQLAQEFRKDVYDIITGNRTS